MHTSKDAHEVIMTNCPADNKSQPYLQNTVMKADNENIYCLFVS
jgi:hypothetical protein